MASDSVEAMRHLHRLLYQLRADWYAQGRGEEFEDLVEQYRADGRWPFDA